MTTVEEGLGSQIRNIESTYGKPIASWIELIRSSGKVKHPEVVAMLKSEYGMPHGSAHRVALVARDALAGSPRPAAGGDPAIELYSGRRAPLMPIHNKLMVGINKLGTDVGLAPKKGYLSLRRKKLFGMIQPAAAHVDVGLVLKGQRPAIAWSRPRSSTRFSRTV